MDSKYNISSYYHCRYLSAYIGMIDSVYKVLRIEPKVITYEVVSTSDGSYSLSTGSFRLGSNIDKYSTYIGDEHSIVWLIYE